MGLNFQKGNENDIKYVHTYVGIYVYLIIITLPNSTSLPFTQNMYLATIQFIKN